MAAARSSVDPELDARAPAELPAESACSFATAARLRRRCFTAKGDPEAPLSQGELRAKFLAWSKASRGYADLGEELIGDYRLDQRRSVRGLLSRARSQDRGEGACRRRQHRCPDDQADAPVTPPRLCRPRRRGWRGRWVGPARPVPRAGRLALPPACSDTDRFVTTDELVLDGRSAAFARAVQTGASRHVPERPPRRHDDADSPGPAWAAPSQRLAPRAARFPP